MREPSGSLDANARIAPLTGTLLKGAHHTVVRVDATVTVEAGAAGSWSIFFSALLNNHHAGPNYTGHGTACADTHPYCTLSMSLWFDIDQLEADYPGMFVGKPLTVALQGGALTGGGSGQTYWATFDAQVVKK